MSLNEKDLPSRWWDPHIHQDRKPFLIKRQVITHEIRKFFYNQSFIEVEATCLQISPGNETHISAFETNFYDGSNQKQRLYLHTSPEFMCKKLLAAGETKLFTLAKVFRNRERGPLHHPEFTMLEWYRTDDIATLYCDMHELIKAAARSVNCQSVNWKGKSANPYDQPLHISVVEAFSLYAKIDLLPLLNDLTSFSNIASNMNIRISNDDTWSDIFSKIMSQCIEPHLGQDRLTFLTDYPASEAALAKLNPKDNRFAQRFEAYLCGVEISNAFAELTNPEEQRSRFQHAMQEKQRIYGESYPIDEDFMDALSLMPEACGIALGLDRLIMLLSHAQHIEQIIWAPIETKI